MLYTEININTIAMSDYKWNYCSLGGVTRVKIASGEDIAHLGELDQKKWTVLSCPSKGLEFDAETLRILDSNNDGTIHVGEVTAAASWLTSVIKDKDLILNGSDTLPLDQINKDNETGARLLKAARQILANLGLKKKEISLADVSDRAAIFAQTRFNGDGIITPASAEEAPLQELIARIVETEGALTDRSGEPGTDADHIEKFYADCAAYSAWKAAADATVFPYGDKTADALAACEAVKDKVADFFVRCKLIAFNEDCAGAVDVSTDRIAAISGNNLATEGDEIATYPIARPNEKGILSYDAVNPSWQAAVAACRTLALDVDYPRAKGIDEAQWNAVLAKFDAYKAWCAAKAGAEVEPLGLDAVEAILKEDRKAALLELVASDMALEQEANDIAEVDKLLHLYRWFYKFLCNYVSFTDLYTPDRSIRAMFEVGDLYIDERCCNLCFRVEDMGKQAETASYGGMYLIYCNCVHRTKGTSMTIGAVMTDGKLSNLRPGKNAIFYDRAGEIWDATVTKIIENPLSIKQAFWSPYRRFANSITDRINKRAAEKEAKVNSNMTESAGKVNVPTNPEDKQAGAAAVNKATSSFDIAKFAGIFAAIGLAVGFLTTALAALIAHWYTPLIVLLVLVICISGPSMFLAWQKLRKRNLGPVLNANGWAVNSSILINILFGKTLTSVAKYPMLKNAPDPFAAKKTPCWKKWLRGILCTILVLGIAFGILYWTGTLQKWGLFGGQQAEEPVAEMVEAQADAPAEAEAPAEPAPEN